METARHREERTELSSVHFNATIAHEYKTTVCADGGLDETMIDDHRVSDIRNSGAVIRIRPLEKEIVLNMAADAPGGTPTQIKYHSELTADTDIHVRHGSSLRIRNLRWLVTKKRLAEPLLGCPLLEALSLDTCKFWRPLPKSTVGWSTQQIWIFSSPATVQGV